MSRNTHDQTMTIRCTWSLQQGLFLQTYKSISQYVSHFTLLYDVTIYAISKTFVSVVYSLYTSFNCTFLSAHINFVFRFAAYLYYDIQLQYKSSLILSCNMQYAQTHFSTVVICTYLFCIYNGDCNSVTFHNYLCASSEANNSNVHLLCWFVTLWFLD